MRLPEILSPEPITKLSEAEDVTPEMEDELLKALSARTKLKYQSMLQELFPVKTSTPVIHLDHVRIKFMFGRAWVVSATNVEYLMEHKLVLYDDVFEHFCMTGIARRLYVPKTFPTLKQLKNLIKVQ